MFCQKCGHQISESDNICPNCGTLKYGKKFCQYCGETIDNECVVCPKCGKQVDLLKTNQYQQPQVVINNANNSVNTNTNTNINRNGAILNPIPKDKWTAFFLCLFLGFFGAHKFYEGKIGMGIIYMCTLGLFTIGWFFDLFIILSKPNPYYV